MPDERPRRDVRVRGGAGAADRVEHVVEGRLTGSLVREPRGTGGFGYDPIFVPDGETRTTAEMSPEEKNAITHRGNAFRALAPAIRRMVLADA